MFSRIVFKNFLLRLPSRGHIPTLEQRSQKKTSNIFSNIFSPFAPAGAHSNLRTFFSREFFSKKFSPFAPQGARSNLRKILSKIYVFQKNSLRLPPRGRTHSNLGEKRFVKRFQNFFICPRGARALEKILFFSK